MKKLIDKLREKYCNMFHDDYTMPVRGKVRCRRCPWREIDATPMVKEKLTQQETQIVFEA